MGWVPAFLQSPGLLWVVMPVHQEGIPAVGGLDNRDRVADQFKRGIQFGVPLRESISVEFHDVRNAYLIGEDQEPGCGMVRNGTGYVPSIGRFDDRCRYVERLLSDHVPFPVEHDLLQRYVVVDNGALASRRFAHEDYMVVLRRTAERCLPEQIACGIQSKQPHVGAAPIREIGRAAHQVPAVRCLDDGPRAVTVAGPIDLAPFFRQVPVSFEHQKIFTGSPGDGNPAIGGPDDRLQDAIDLDVAIQYVPRRIEEQNPRLTHRYDGAPGRLGDGRDRRTSAGGVPDDGTVAVDLKDSVGLILFTLRTPFKSTT